MLSDEEFLSVVKNAPLVAIDLIVVDKDDRVLVGKRINNPAKGTWFVPGGRIKRGETLDEAFQRIATAELGEGPWNRKSARCLGVFEHFYSTNFLEVDGIGTHYVVLAYAIDATSHLFDLLPADQHSRFEFVDEDGTTDDRTTLPLHANTVAYFDLAVRKFDTASVTESQYGLLNSRRDAFNTLLWQIPTLTLTGLAFVFIVILTAESRFAMWVATAIAFAVSAVGLLVMTKHRSYEKHLALFLTDYEQHAGIAQINEKLEQVTLIARRSSYRWWIAMYIFLASVATISAVVRTHIDRAMTP